MDELEKELKVGFLEEAAQLLTDTEQCFLDLEKNSDDKTIIEKIFRLAHNLKGSAKAVGFVEMGEFTHILESLLLKLKTGDLKTETAIVSLLLACNDHLKVWIEVLKADLAASVDSKNLTEQLTQAIAGQLSAPATQDEAVSTPVETFEAEAPVVANPLTTESTNFEAPTHQLMSAPEEIKPAVLTQKAPPTPASAPATAPKSATQQAPDESIRVSLKRLEKLMNNVGELVILQTVLNQQRSQVASPLLQKTIVQLSKITKDIQEISMSLRMVPLKQTFQKMQRIVRDTSQNLQKEVEFHLSGEETELDKTVVESLGDPLVHLIRNAVDHGLESPEERVKLGKSKAGNISLAAFHKGGQIVIEIRDDGRGLNPEKLKAKAIEKGLITAHQKLTDQQARELIFAPGFSTKEVVTDVSGRGVGMDVVKTNIEKLLQGEVQLESTVGEGTRIRILLPLTLAIIDAMVVRSEEERYIIPVAHVHESIQPNKEDVHLVTGLGEVLSLRGEELPLHRLTTLLGKKTSTRPATDCIAVVVRSSETPFSVLVDDIIGQQQVVIKRLGIELQNLRGVTGGAILGDGRAALILDVNELILKISGKARSHSERREAA